MKTSSFFDSKLDIEPKSRSSSWVFVIILLFFIIGAIFFTQNKLGIFEEQNALDNADGLFFAVQALTSGDTEGFVEGIVAVIPLLGIFMVLFAIFHFLFVKLFHIKHATILAVVLSIYPIIDNRIYNYLLSLNAFVIGFLVFLAMLIMIWGLSDHGVKSVKDQRDFIRKLKADPKLADDKENVKKIKQLLKELG